MDGTELITALVNQTDHNINEFTGGAIIQTVINNKTLIKYKVSLYFGYENKKPLTRIIEIDKDVYFALPQALDDYLNNTVKLSDSKVFTMNKPTGRSTTTPTPTSTPTNTITLNTNTIAFEMFWENYPKKTDKKRAKLSFDKLTKAKQKLATEDCKERFDETENKYIPNPTTYLNGERWEDELTNKSIKKTGFYGGLKIHT